jgi:hypothetical protein
VHLDVRIQVELERAKAADDVLRRIGAVDAEDELLRPARDELPLGGEHSVATRQLVELGRIDGDRMHRHERPLPVPCRRALGEVGLGAGEIGRGPQEVEPPAVGVEADHVVREHALVNRAPDRVGEDVPVVRLRPGNVDEVRKERLGRPLADGPRRQVEVVVVEEDGRFRLQLELLEHGLGERFVHAHVALVPGVLERDVERRRVRQLPEVVLQEPQHRVRDDVVEPVVGGLLVRDEPEAEGRTVSRGLLHCRTVGLCDQRAILARHRARDPGDVVVGDEAPERGDEPAAPAPRYPVAAFVTPERDRPAIGDDDQLPPGAHQSESLTAASSGRRREQPLRQR